MSTQVEHQQESALTSVPLGPGGRPALVGRRIFPRPLWRRVTYALIFETFGVGFTTLILSLLGNPPTASVLVGIFTSVTALIWNLVFNWIFEAWERRSGHTGRPWWVRVLHAVFFEVGLILLLVPLTALLLQVSLWEAFLYQAVLIVFFLIYTAVYAWCFDRVFGLPDAAQPASEPTPATATAHDSREPATRETL